MNLDSLCDEARRLIFNLGYISRIATTKTPYRTVQNVDMVIYPKQTLTLSHLCEVLGIIKDVFGEQAGFSVDARRTCVIIKGIVHRIRDDCQVCDGTRGIPGNEQIINGVTMCDYCHAAQK